MRLVEDAANRQARVRTTEIAGLASDSSWQTLSPVEYDVTVERILHEVAWDDEDRGAELRNPRFPLPAKVHDFLFAQAGVDLEERHRHELRRQPAPNELAGSHCGSRISRSVVVARLEPVADRQWTPRFDGHGGRHAGCIERVALQSYFARGIEYRRNGLDA